MTTKAEARARKAAWQLALSEGRVVRANGGMFFSSYSTREIAEKQVADLRAGGINDAEIVQYNH